MTKTRSSARPVFAISDQHPAKADPALIDADERHFAAIASALDEATGTLTKRLDGVRKIQSRQGQVALDRDQEVHRLTSRLKVLRRFGVDLCLGRIVHAGQPAPVYIGRVGLTDKDGSRLLVDWRAPAAEPFFAATHANPMGLVSRRRYRWMLGRVTDYWDEVFAEEAMAGNAALDEQSAFIASLGASRSPRMRDVLSTIQADQDAIIRAGSRGALVVEGGPGTGKTVVALHRTAYLLYADPPLARRSGGVLYVGPHQPYLNYVADVLPSLGEEGVRACTLRDLVPESAAATAEADPDVGAIKSSARMIDMVDAAVRFFEEPPTEGLEVATDWGDVWLSSHDWADAFGSLAPGTPHNEGRDEVWESLVAILVDKIQDEEVAPELRRRSIESDRNLVDTFSRAWPLLAASDLLGDLWSIPAYLRRCAPWLDAEELRLLQRAEPYAWTDSDLPLLDAARFRLGDPEAARRERQRRAAVAAQRDDMRDVVDDLIAADDSEMLVMSMLRRDDLAGALVDESALPNIPRDDLAGPFAHVVIDEAQELTDAEWLMILRRCPSHSMTIVGDRAQARHGFAESWVDRLARVGWHTVAVASLTINYRTPQEIMARAEPVIRAVVPDANVPTSIRPGGVPVRWAPVADLGAIIDGWIVDHPEGTACVISQQPLDAAALPASAQVRALTPVLAKGLEFDLVVLIDPDAFGRGFEGAVDRYVAMTRATQALVILTTTDDPVPAVRG